MDKTMACKVCGRLARGVSYGVTACVSCRSFYRRCMKKPENLRPKCRGNGSCITASNNKVDKRFRPCKACRFRKYCTLRCKSQLPGKNNTKDTGTSRDIQTAESIPMLAEESEIQDAHVDPADGLNHFATHPVEKSLERSPGSELDDQAIPLCESRVQSQITIQGVHKAVHVVFSDQISEWTKCLTSAVRDGRVVSQPQADTDEIIMAISDHYVDNLQRTLKFFEMLPGIEKLDMSIKQHNIFSWKASVSYLVHHAPFASSNETYFTIGDKQFHYCRYWQEDERVTNWSFQEFFYKFCTDVRDIGLEKIERYLLIAIVLLEPACDDAMPDGQLSAIHRHYTDALLHVIRERSSSHSECMNICRKLVGFFDKIKVVQPLMDWLFYDGSPNLPSSKEITALLSGCGQN